MKVQVHWDWILNLDGTDIYQTTSLERYNRIPDPLLFSEQSFKEVMKEIITQMGIITKAELTASAQVSTDDGVTWDENDDDDPYDWYITKFAENEMVWVDRDTMLQMIGQPPRWIMYGKGIMLDDGTLQITALSGEYSRGHLVSG